MVKGLFIHLLRIALRLFIFLGFNHLQGSTSLKFVDSRTRHYKIVGFFQYFILVKVGLVFPIIDWLP